MNNNQNTSKSIRTSVKLTEENILQYVEKCQEMLPPEHPQQSIDCKLFSHLDLSKPLRGNSFGIIHILLQNPLREMLSSSPPCINGKIVITVFSSMFNFYLPFLIFIEVDIEKAQSGMIFLYGSSCEDYLNDGINWAFQSKMNLKLILFDNEKKVYKVKNSKNDIGDIVMRRQSWSVADDSGWHRIEYKIFQDETVYKQNIDGTTISTNKRTLNKFPVLVHYFIKKNEIYNYSNPRKKQKTGKEKDGYNYDIAQYNYNVIPQQLNDDNCLFDSFFYDSDIFHNVDEPSLYEINVIKSAPDCGFCLENTRVIVVLKDTSSNQNTQFLCNFNGIEIPMTRIIDNVFEFITPIQNSSSIVQWNVISKTKDDFSGDIITNYSEPKIYYYLPSDSKGYISLAYTLVPSFQNEFVMSKFRYIIREMDLSNNNLERIDFLKGFINLQSLILDYNNITENSEFPIFPSLTNLSVNTNKIVVIEKFCDILTISCPKIKFLSMLGNEACPIFSPLPHHYYNFRIYVISRLSLLQLLDSESVTEEERKHASFIIDRDLPPPFHLDNDF